MFKTLCWVKHLWFQLISSSALTTNIVADWTSGLWCSTKLPSDEIICNAARYVHFQWHVKLGWWSRFRHVQMVAKLETWSWTCRVSWFTVGIMACTQRTRKRKKAPELFSSLSYTGVYRGCLAHVEERFVWLMCFQASLPLIHWPRNGRTWTNHNLSYIRLFSCTMYIHGRMCLCVFKASGFHRNHLRLFFPPPPAHSTALQLLRQFRSLFCYESPPLTPLLPAWASVRLTSSYLTFSNH